jgi:hypothetical protein
MIPGWILVVALVVAVAVVLGMWLSGLANRLNRLHIRTDSARINLEGALRARSSVVAALRPDLSTEAGHASTVALRASDMDARSGAENRLLRELTDSERRNPAFIEASTKVDLAARFYNDAVGDTREVRGRPVVRLFRLAGKAPLPEYYEALSAGDDEL